MSALDTLGATERLGYLAFQNDETPDEPLARLIRIGELEAVTLFLSGWFCGAREVFAEGAVASWALEEEGRRCQNPYPSAEKVAYYDVFQSKADFERWVIYSNVNPDTLKPRARQWHQGFTWQMEQS